MVTIIMMSSLTLFQTKSYKPYFAKGGIATCSPLVHQLLSSRWMLGSNKNVCSIFWYIRLYWWWDIKISHRKIQLLTLPIVIILNQTWVKSHICWILRNNNGFRVRYLNSYLKNSCLAELIIHVYKTIVSGGKS